jgi:2-polyprenyl-6-methoxyphenol hydroxylase-like FAD-dependent oxidoreductase
VTYIFGSLIESFEEGSGGVEVRFKDSKPDTLDLLGADGYSSRTRKLLLGAAAAASIRRIRDHSPSDARRRGVRRDVVDGA